MRYRKPARKEVVTRDHAAEKQRIVIDVLNDDQLTSSQYSSGYTFVWCVTPAADFVCGQSVGIADSARLARFVEQHDSPAVQPQQFGQ